MRKVGHAFSDHILADNGFRKRHTSSLMHTVATVFPLFILFVLFAILFFRLFYVQVVRGAYYSNLAMGNRVRSKVIESARGIIFDRNNKPLVRNIPSFKTLDKDGKVKILDKEEALQLIAQHKEKEVQIAVEREYIYKDAFAHVLGYIGQIDKKQLVMSEYRDYNVLDFVGQMGLEQEYESLLHGKNGKELYEVDATGTEQKKLGYEEPVVGKNLKTTLDVSLQVAAHDAFSEVQKGAVVVSSPKDGSILALYSKPSFDTNLFTHTSSYKPQGDYPTIISILHDTNNQPFLDRAIAGVYPPGSTFKLITASAGIEKGTIKKDTLIEDTGVLQVGTFSYGNWYYSQYGKKEGMLDVVGALKRSNDIFFYKAAEEIGPSDLAKMAKKFGLGQQLGIDLGNERRGVVPTEEWKKEEIGEQWYLGDTFHYGIGQGYLLTTPLQVNFFTTLFANGGTLYKPHLIDGRVEVLQKNFLKDGTIGTIRQGMRESCSPGGVAWPFFDFKVPSLGSSSGRKIDGLDFTEDSSGSAKMVKITVGCKTGTAETTADQKPHAWITVIAPFYHPEVVVTVLVENSGEGSNIAAPIARKILEKYFEEK